MDSFLLWAVPIAAVIALALIYWVPRFLIPAPSSSKRDEVVSVIAARNEIRKTSAQLLAGASFVLTFLLSTYNFNRDFTQKAKQASAEQFSKALARVTDNQSESWSAVGAFQVLSEIARQDPYYHQAVFRTMAQYLVDTSRTDCGIGVDSKGGSVALKDTAIDYTMRARVQLVARIFADHDVSNDYIWRHFELEGACLSGVKWKDGFGLANLYMPRVRLVRADLRNANLEGTIMHDAKGGVDEIPDWWSANKGLGIYEDLKILQDGKGKEEIYYWANFSKANLSRVHADRAHFRGASFSEANLKNSNWQDAELQMTDLSRANLSGADFSRAKFEGANFNEADLTDAHVVNAKFENANLKDASFTNTNVAFADFSRARNLAPSQLRWACIWLARDDIQRDGKKDALRKAQPGLPIEWSNRDRDTVAVPECHAIPVMRWFRRANVSVTTFLSTIF